MASMTRVRVASVTKVLPLRTRETVACDTPAYRATSTTLTIWLSNTLAGVGRHGHEKPMVPLHLSASRCANVDLRLVAQFLMTTFSFHPLSGVDSKTVQCKRYHHIQRR